MQNDKHRLDAILNDPGSTAAEKAVAQAQLAALERNNTAMDFSDQNIARLLTDDGVLGVDDEWLRACYLFDDTAPIEWAWLALWRDRLDSKSPTLRVIAERMIRMLSEYDKVPADVRQAATNLIVQSKTHKAGDPLPELPIPGKKPVDEFTDEELYYRYMVPLKKKWIQNFGYAPR
jgi:hypothetical protein